MVMMRLGRKFVALKSLSRSIQRMLLVIGEQLIKIETGKTLSRSENAVGNIRRTALRDMSSADLQTLD